MGARRAPDVRVVAGEGGKGGEEEGEEGKKGGGGKECATRCSGGQRCGAKMASCGDEDSKTMPHDGCDRPDD